MLTAFLHSDFAQPKGTIIGVEEELRGVLIPGCPDLLARVDLIVDAGDALVVTDFKTARRGWSHDQVMDAAPQLLLYSSLVRDLSDGKPLRLEFAVMTKTKAPDLTVHSVPLDAHQIERTKGIVESVWRAIQTGHFFPSPSPLNCPTCPFQGPCQAWSG
jgi:CRISPR/Cas system-associated exonuclease Cas4 (RecB family)